MPLYEYQCRDCDQEVEVLVRGEERPECPSCGGSGLTKLLSLTAAPVARGRPDSAEPAGPCGSACGCFPQG